MKKSYLVTIIISLTLIVVSAIVILISSNNIDDRNSDPQISDGPTNEEYLLVEMYHLSGDRYFLVEASNNFSAAINAKGQLYTWGKNNFGQLGHGDFVDVDTPKVVSSLENEVIVNITLSNNQTFVVTKSGLLYSFGSNEYNTISTNKTNEHINLPVVNEYFKNNNILIEKVVSLNNTVLVLSKDGLVYGYGNNEYYLLSNIYGKQYNLINFNDELISDITILGSSALALSKNGNVYSWGSNKNKTLGFNKDSDIQLIPKKLKFKDNIIQIASGVNHSLVLTQNNELYAWGLNSYGQLGLNDLNERLLPTLVNLEHFDIKSINATKQHGSYFVTSDNSFYYFGNNNNKVVYNNIDNYLTKPTQIILNNNIDLTGLATGSNHTLYYDEDGKVAVNGINSFGELGIIDLEETIIPVRLNNLEWALFDSYRILKGNYLENNEYEDINLILDHWFYDENFNYEILSRVILTDNIQIYGRWRLK